MLAHFEVHHGPYIWIGSKGHYEFCHVDSDDGVLCMLKGTTSLFISQSRDKES